MAPEVDSTHIGVDTSASSPGEHGDKLMGKAGYLDFLDPSTLR